MWICALIGFETDRSLITQVGCLLQDRDELIKEEDVGTDGGHEGLHYPFTELDHDLGGPILILGLEAHLFEELGNFLSDPPP